MIQILKKNKLLRISKIWGPTAGGVKFSALQIKNLAEMRHDGAHIRGQILIYNPPKFKKNIIEQRILII